MILLHSVCLNQALLISLTKFQSENQPTETKHITCWVTCEFAGIIVRVIFIRILNAVANVQCKLIKY